MVRGRHLTLKYDERIKELVTKFHGLQKLKKFLMDYHPDQGTAFQRTVDLQDSIQAILKVWYDVKVGDING